MVRNIAASVAVPLSCLNYQNVTLYAYWDDSTDSEVLVAVVHRAVVLQVVHAEVTLIAQSYRRPDTEPQGGATGLRQE